VRCGTTLCPAGKTMEKMEKRESDVDA